MRPTNEMFWKMYYFGFKYYKCYAFVYGYIVVEQSLDFFSASFWNRKKIGRTDCSLLLFSFKLSINFKLFQQMLDFSLCRQEKERDGCKEVFTVWMMSSSKGGLLLALYISVQHTELLNPFLATDSDISAKLESGEIHDRGKDFATLGS